jgi:hypothetical protein
MGVWESERGYVSDDVDDILDEALRKIEKCWWGDYDESSPNSKRFTMIDLADAIEFTTRGILRVEINPEAKHLRDLRVDQLFPKYKRATTNLEYIKKREKMHFKNTGVKTFDNRGMIK